MMNKWTRKLSKIPEEVRAEIEPYLMDCSPILDEDGRKLPKLGDSTADCVRTGLTPRWNDLDVNQHVSNLKYIGCILERDERIKLVLRLYALGHKEYLRYHLLPNPRTYVSSKGFSFSKQSPDGCTVASAAADETVLECFRDSGSS